jgi:energy-coupling factor transporter ATP-binding protein EcfA2
MSETQKIIYSMVRVGKTHPPKNRVLRDISLSYFYGAKIGVLGLNGAGKSTLLRIMAGVETEFDGYSLIRYPLYPRQMIKSLYPYWLYVFMICQRIGLPPISTIGLGLVPVSSEIRVPRPPANITTFIISICLGAKILDFNVGK